MNKIKLLAMLLFSGLSIYMVIKGQSIRSYSGFLMMLIGLTALIAELYLYNKKYS